MSREAITERYNANETMKMVGACNYTLEELGKYGGHPEIKQIVEAYIAETESKKLITNVDAMSLLYDVFLLGTIHGVKRERRRRHNASKEV